MTRPKGNKNGRRSVKHNLTHSYEESDSKKLKQSNSLLENTTMDSDTTSPDVTPTSKVDLESPGFWKQLEGVVSRVVNESLDARLASTTKTVEENKNKLSTITPKVNEHSDKIAQLEEKISQLESKLTKQDCVIEKLTTTVDSNDNKTSAAITEVKSDVKTHDEDIYYLHSHNDELDQYGRRNTLRVTGIPEQENENLIDFIVDMAKKHMKITIQKHEIDRAHRLNQVKAKKDDADDAEEPPPRAVVVKFVSYQTRYSFYDKRKSLKGTGLFVNEHLTRPRAKLLFDAREYKRSDKIANAWSTDGRIMVKTKGDRYFTINSIKQLDYYLTLKPKKSKLPNPATSKPPEGTETRKLSYAGALSASLIEPFENVLSSTTVAAD